MHAPARLLFVRARRAPVFVSPLFFVIYLNSRNKTRATNVLQVSPTFPTSSLRDNFQRGKEYYELDAGDRGAVHLSPDQKGVGTICSPNAGGIIGVAGRH